MQIKANAPTRIDLAGGTIDIWPIWAILGEATTINVAIDLPSEVIVSIPSKRFKNTPNNTKNALINGVLEYYNSNCNLTQQIDIKIKSYYPKRAGLAGSSSVLLSLISCLDAYLEIKRSYAETINLASNLEAKILRGPTGTQDYYPILWGGINVMHYCLNQVKHELIPLEGEIYESFKDSILLVKPKGFHESGNLNWILIREFIEGKENTIFQINRIMEAANLVYDSLQDGNVTEFYKGINIDMSARKSFGKDFVPEALCRLEEELGKRNLNGAKICGAGGDACLALFCRPRKRETVAQFIEEKGFHVIMPTLRMKGMEISQLH